MAKCAKKNRNEFKPWFRALEQRLANGTITLWAAPVCLLRGLRLVRTNAVSGSGSND